MADGLWAAYRAAMERLLAEGWEGDLETAIADSPEVTAAHLSARRVRRFLTDEEQGRTQRRVEDIKADLLRGVVE